MQHSNPGSSKYVVINFDEWNFTTPYPKPVQQVSLNVPSNVIKAKVEYLTAPGVEADQNITWGGMSYGYDSNGLGVQVTNNSKTITPINGVFNVSVLCTEAIVVTLIRHNGHPNTGTITPTSGYFRPQGHGGLAWWSALLIVGGLFIMQDPDVVETDCDSN